MSEHTPLNVSLEQLLTMLGEKEVTIALLRAEIARLKVTQKAEE